MKANTLIHMAIMNVGDSKEPVAVFNGGFPQCVMELARWLGTRNMATRFDIVIARSQEEARGAMVKRKAIVAESQEVEDIMAQLSRLIENGEVENEA